MICHISTSGSNLNRHAVGILKDRFPPDWPKQQQVNRDFFFSSYYYSFRILQVYTRWWKGEIGLSSSWAAKWTDDKKRKLVSSCERSLYRTSLREVAAAVLAIAAAPILRRTTSPSYLFPVSALTAINPCIPPLVVRATIGGLSPPHICWTVTELCFCLLFLFFFFPNDFEKLRFCFSFEANSNSND